jgi:hypothetical protein
LEHVFENASSRQTREHKRTTKEEARTTNSGTTRG